MTAGERAIRAAHRDERQLPAATLSERHGTIVGACCHAELSDPLDYFERAPLSAVALERAFGRAVRCYWCGERILDEAGLPLDIIPTNE